MTTGSNADDSRRVDDGRGHLLERGDISHRGVDVYLSTDQVRFYRAGGAAPIALADVPPLAFSEVMRFLPFDGDTTLSIIVSKALLLADDRSITDPVIVSQITRR